MTTEASSENVPETTTAAKATKPKWEVTATDRIKTSLKTMSKPLAGLIDRDANEGDTRHFVTDFLCSALGFDRYEDLTTEYQVKGDFADYGVRIDKQLVAFIEVKRATTKLNEKHLKQVEAYAIHEGVEWGILTNGNDWQVYHLAPAAPKPAGTSGPLVDIHQTIAVSIIGEGTPAQKVRDFLLLSKESMKRRQIDEVWKASSATSPKALANLLVTPPVLDAIRREVRRTTGHNPATSDIKQTLESGVIRPNL